MYPFNAAEIFKISLDIEENGRKFYEAAEKIIEDPKVKKILSDLAIAEIQHKIFFKTILDKLPTKVSQQTVWDPDNELDKYLKMMADQHVFRSNEKVEELLKDIKTREDALILASQFEKDSIVLYAELKEQANSKESKAEVHKILEEEQEHLRIIMNMLANLSA